MGRLTGEVSRLIYDLMEHTETVQIPGLLLSIDFEKAFDSVDRQCLTNVLKFFNFGPGITQWIETLNNAIESRVLADGFARHLLNRTRMSSRRSDSPVPFYALCRNLRNYDSEEIKR